MRGVDKIIITLRKVDYITVELSGENDYELPDSVLGFHALLTHIKTDPAHYVDDVHLAEAQTEFIIDSIVVKEEIR
jgi:hypothetical protein